MSEENEKNNEKKDALELEGTVVEALRGRFRIQIENSDHIVLAQLAGKLRKNFIKVIPGDKVRVEVSAYDVTRGRITYRHK